MRQLLLFFTVTIIIVACKGRTSVSQETANDKVTVKLEYDTVQVKIIDGWKILNTQNYSIQYPPDWVLDTNQTLESFTLYAPQKNHKDSFKTKIDLSIDDLNGKNYGFNKYAELLETDITSSFDNYKIIERNLIKKDSTEYRTFTFTGDFPSDEGGTWHMELEDYIYIYKNKAYSIEFVGEENNFIRFKEVSEKIMRTFKIKE